MSADFLEQSRLLMDVIQCQSLGRAARRNGVSVSQVSRQLDALEKELGVILLHRSSKGSIPTSKGALFAEKMAEICSELIEVERSMKSGIRKRAIFVLPDSHGELLFTPWITKFQRKFPEFHLNFVLESMGNRVSLQGADYCIVMQRLPPEERMVAIRLGSVPLICIASPYYLESVGDVMAVQDLTEHKLFVCEKDTEFPIVFRQKAQIQRFTFEYQNVDSLIALKHAVKAGGGIGIAVPKYMVQKELNNGELIQVLTNRYIEPEVMWLLRAPQRYPSLMGQQILQWFRKCWSETPGLRL